MPRSPFYAYPFQHPHPFFSHNAFAPHLPPHSPPSSPSPTSGSAHSSTRPIIHIPVHDSSAPSPPPPPSTLPLRPVNHPSPAPAPATSATSPSPLLDPASAATTIQSHFRGFSIRRHRPLRHLRYIAQARKQLEELKLELENSGFAPKVRASDKERLRFSESVMAVILRLDAIEGSIPEVRSQRKEATKMAIKLQDAIDAIMMQQEEISDPKPGDGALSHAGTAEDRKQHSEESLCCDVINMATMLGGGQTSATDAYMMQEAAPTFLVDGLTSPETDMAATAMMDLDNNDVMKMVHESVPCLPLLRAENAGLQVVDSGHISGSPESGSQDVSAEGMDAADHDMWCAHEKVAGGEGTDVVEADVHGGIDSGCAGAHSSIVQEDMPVAKEYEDICVDEGKDSNCDSGKDVIADRSFAFMDAGQEDEEGFSCPGTSIAVEKLDHPHHSSDATTVAPDHVHCASPPEVHLGDQYQGASALEDPLLEKLTESNSSSQGADDLTLCRHGYENLKDEGKVPPSTDSKVKTPLSSDSILLQQLSEDCRQLKSLLGKVLAHSAAQSKVICALGDRLEMLEHQQELNCQNSSRKTCEKRKSKKGSKRNVKAPKH